MIHDLKPYPAYKDSGVPWLGKVPEHWEVLPNRALFEEVKERDCPDEQLLSVTISQGVIQQTDLLTNSSKKDSSNEDKTKYKLVKPGDIAYNKMRAWQGAVGVSKYRGIVSPAYVVVHPRDTQNPSYFHYLLRTPAFAKEAERWSYGITSDQWSLRPEHFKMIYCSLPPKEEQSAIVRYLDHIDRRIWHYIRAKKKLIKLLEEQKQAIIHQAVTRGLDPNVKLKPSGIEWLEEIPEHWEVLPLKALSTVQSGITLGKQYLGQKLVEFPYLRVANVQEGHVNLSEIKTIEVPAEEAKRSRLQKGDVLMTEGGDPDKLGRGCVWEGQVSPCLHQNHIFAVRPNINRLRPYYLGILLSSQYSKEYFLRTGKQTTNLASTNKTTIGQFPIPLPKVEEQDLILDKVENELEGIERAMSGISREISILREYRTRLIADVVTGKLDVREAAANLSDKSDEIEVEDDFEEETIEESLEEIVTEEIVEGEL